MTDKEKMLSGHQLYRSDDSELMRDRENTRRKVFEYNHTFFCAGSARQTELLRSFIPDAGEGVYIEPPVAVDYGYNVKLGSNFYANYNCIFIDSGKITVGNNVKFGPCVSVLTAEHPVNPELRAEHFESVAEVVIGNNVWIGGGTVILPGVVIGDNAVIGGGSVVKKDIPDNSLAVGNPCQVIGDVRKWHKKRELL